LPATDETSLFPLLFLLAQPPDFIAQLHYRAHQYTTLM
jgi:hypothetical protein